LEKDNPNKRLPIDGKSKAQALKEVGISTSTAQRYEELAGPREEQAQEAIKAATEHYLAESRETDTPATIKELKRVVRSALVATLGEPPKHTRRASDHRYIRFIGSIRDIVEPTDFDPEFLASETDPIFVLRDLEFCNEAIQRISQFSYQLEIKHPYVRAKTPVT
jgi:hypothetical protein